LRDSRRDAALLGPLLVVLGRQQLIIKLHREDAFLVAAQRLVEFVDADDVSGVMQAVDELQRIKPKVGEKVN
jgi:hypothetical protein